MRLIKESGADSMPGGGAEIFHPEIRDEIAGGKCSGEEWLEIHRIWHKLGQRSNATMLYGHIENTMHRIDHLEKLRALQDETSGFQTFIPLKFRNKGNEMSHISESTTVEDMRMYAVSRIYLDNFDHIKAYWPMIGRDTTQTLLAFGVNDVDGTIDDTTKIYSMAGSEEQTPALSTAQLVKLIRAVDRKPIERDTLYNVINDYTDTVFEDDDKYKGYIALPVNN
jgi:aminodeoxyfutalosine synthase